MKPLAEYLDLIQGKKLEEFVQEHPHPVLIGLGVIASELQRNPAKAAGTMFVNLSAMPGDDERSPQLNQVFEITGADGRSSDQILIGSAPENDISIPDSSLSKNHGHFVFKDSECYVVDQGSTNGSFINGSRLEPNTPSLLKGGDVLTLGRLSFTYYDALSFAKLLAVQAMARGRGRRTPRTPGSARLTPTSRLPTATPGGTPQAAPWARKPTGNIRSTGVVQQPSGPSPWQPGGGPPSGEWRQRAIGTIPPGQPGASTRTTGQGSGQPGTNLPAHPPRKSWFARLLLWIARWLQRLAGGE